jgi:hypothetical protein
MPLTTGLEIPGVSTQCMILPMVKVIQLKESRTRYAHWNMKITVHYMIGSWMSWKYITRDRLNLPASI